MIDVHELKQVMAGLGEQLTDRELKEMMDEADVDGNGGVDFEGRKRRKRRKMRGRKGEKGRKEQY